MNFDQNLIGDDNIELGGLKVTTYMQTEGIYMKDSHYLTLFLLKRST